jgi:PAS domain S-box-containing protein
LYDWAGKPEAYGITGLQKGKYIGEQIYFLEGLFPPGCSPMLLPCIEIKPGLFIDVHIFPGDGGDWVLLLDVTADATERRLVQQKANDLRLIEDKRLPNESILADLFPVLDLAVMERLDNGSFRTIGAVPDWFVRFYPDAALEGDGLQPGKKFLFLENFLTDAEYFWTENNPGRLKSGLWIEIDSLGNEYGFEASAICLRGRKMLLIESLGASYEEKRSVIQRARENNLDYQYLVRVEKALRKSEAKNRALLSAIPDSMFRIRKDSTYLDFIPAKGLELSILPGELLGKKVYEVLPAELAQKVMYYVTRALQSGNTQVFEYQILLDDAKRDFEARIVVSGEDEVLAIVRDITEHKRMEEELLKVQKLESMGILAGGIAHDFNNLLTGILGNVSLIRMYMDPEDNKTYNRLSEAEKACLRAQDLTQQLLTFSKGGAPVKRVISIEELIKDSATFAVSGSDVRCEFYISEDLWMVEVDEGQISQVINNVVINADQAMPEGGVIRLKAKNINRGELIAHSSYEGDGLPLKGERYVKVTIEDEGIGIPKEHLTKIFDPYFTTKQRGSGLGLAAAYSIIKKHDGYIAVESKLEVGTKFYIYLPASDKEMLVRESIGHRAVVGKGRVLVMDDEDMIRGVAGEMLNRIGYEVEFARDGTEAIELYRKAVESSRPFDVVIMDLTIPGGMGGREAIKRLLEIDPGIKAIVSSGYSNDPVMSEFSKYGFRDVIPKPYEIEGLSEVLNRVITGISQ